jgi:hypothetical protein
VLLQYAEIQRCFTNLSTFDGNCVFRFDVLVSMIHGHNIYLSDTVFCSLHVVSVVGVWPVICQKHWKTT